jgi:hypothetical protein
MARTGPTAPSTRRRPIGSGGTRSGSSAHSPLRNRLSLRLEPSENEKFSDPGRSSCPSMSAKENPRISLPARRLPAEPLPRLCGSTVNRVEGLLGRAGRGSRRRRYHLRPRSRSFPGREIAPLPSRFALESREASCRSARPAVGSARGVRLKPRPKEILIVSGVPNSF